MAQDKDNVMNSLAGLGLQIGSGLLDFQNANRQAMQIRFGGDVSASGSLMQAAGYRSQIGAEQGALDFNLGIDNINNVRRLRSINRDFQRLLGRQTTEVAKSGISMTSKSALLLRNEALDGLTNAVINFKIDAENERNAKVYQSLARQANLENQARAADYNAQVTRILAKSQASQVKSKGTFSLFSKLGSALGEVPTILSQIKEGPQNS